MDPLHLNFQQHTSNKRQVQWRSPCWYMTFFKIHPFFRQGIHSTARHARSSRRRGENRTTTRIQNQSSPTFERGTSMFQRGCDRAESTHFLYKLNRLPWRTIPSAGPKQKKISDCSSKSMSNMVLFDEAWKENKLTFFPRNECFPQRKTQEAQDQKKKTRNHTKETKSHHHGRFKQT